MSTLWEPAWSSPSLETAPAATVGDIRVWPQLPTHNNARRSPNGYRVYDRSTLTRLNFIRSAQAAGLTLAEIGSIIDLREDGTIPCTHVAGLIDNKITDVRARIRALTVLKLELEGLIERSKRLDPADCTDADVCQILSADRVAKPTAGAQPCSSPS